MFFGELQKLLFDPGLISLMMTLDLDKEVVSTDGKELYGIDVRDTTWSSVGLIRLNATSGDVLARRNLQADVWFIDLANIPKDLVPNGPVEVTTTVNSR